MQTFASLASHKRRAPHQALGKLLTLSRMSAGHEACSWKIKRRRMACVKCWGEASSLAGSYRSILHAFRLWRYDSLHDRGTCYLRLWLGKFENPGGRCFLANLGGLWWFTLDAVAGCVGSTAYLKTIEPNSLHSNIAKLRSCYTRHDFPTSNY